MELNEREKRIYDFLCAREGEGFDIEQIADATGSLPSASGHGKHWRARANLLMRWLIARTGSLDFKVERASRLGRGSKAVFRAVRKGGE